MINLSFNTASDSLEFQDSLQEYYNIWQTEGVRIIESLEDKSGLKFPNEIIEVIIYEGISKSGSKNEPMMLRASYPLDTKRAILIHELSHRLLDTHQIQIPEGWDVHQILNLFLYDVWVDLWGEQFAKEQMEIEKKRSERYQKSWDWALTLTSNDRKIKLAQISSL